MSSLRTSRDWSLLIYRVSGVAHQQKILHAFHRIAWPGITVVGTQAGTDLVVIVDCESATLERHARRIVHRLDSRSKRVLRCRLADSAVAR
jgi:hypothetical protein